MKYKALSPELFQHNRKRFTREMKPGTIAIFNANDQMPRSGDQYFSFRQNAGLYYLSGIDQEETVLLLFPDCPREGHKEVLLIKRTNEHIAVWEGHKYTKEEAQQASGIEKVYFLDEAEVMLNELILLSEGIYLNINENDRFLSPVVHRDLRYAHSIQQRYPAHTLYRSQPILKKLQTVKSHWEIDATQHCIDITGNAFRRVLEFVKPGVWEYEVEAEIIHEFIRSGATGHAYSPIIGSGKNACVLHYVDNNQQCKSGDVLLMDFGRVLIEARAMLVPGNTIEELNKEVGKIMESELLGLGLISKDDVEKQDEDKPAYKKYFMHGTSHHLGLDVHDLMSRYEPFRAGMVFTCEPGIYIPEENLGIRIENNILITDNGPVDMFKNIPMEAEEIEELMQVGVLN